MSKKTLKLITHNGSFHADDVFACATLSLLLEKGGKKFKIIRTRDEKTINKADYVFDVGGVYNPAKNRFDHHQRGFKEKRKNGIPYSSFGLIWKKYGAKLCGNKATADYLDSLLVAQIDANDNAFQIFKPLTSHNSNYTISSVISSFSDFYKAVEFAKNIIKKEIQQFSALLKVKKLIAGAYKKTKNKKLLVLSRDIPRYLADIASRDFKPLLFMVFKDEKNWKVLAVRKTTSSFGNKRNLPKSWAGLTGRDLQKVSGVSDALFCHRALFVATAKSKNGAIKLAELALKN